MHHLDAYNYTLPEGLIAKFPCTPRDHAKLLVIDRQSGNFQDLKFFQLEDFLSEGHLLIYNDTKVIPARLFAHRESGGKVEIFLLRDLGENKWEVLLRPARKIFLGEKLQVAPECFASLIDIGEEGKRTVQFHLQGSFEEIILKYGKMPLPQYLQRDVEESDEKEYQTVYATSPGAVAAPTAGLHFTKEMLSRLRKNGVKEAPLTLHVGLGTFRPVLVENIHEHKMHTEYYSISKKSAEAINQKTPHIVVGTTTCRAMESSADGEGMVKSGHFHTNIFISPGYQFKVVQAMLTNFHLPKSSLLMMVSAFGGYELIREAYKKAIADRYRFYSYGDAMLIL